MNIILYILGYGRSGSSLLSWLLHPHPKILSVGELEKLPNHLLNTDIPVYCGCGKFISECNIWRKIFDKAHHININNIGFEKWNPFIISELQNSKPSATVLVDSSCSSKRFLQLQKSTISKQYTLKTVFISRDSRGVIHSTSNKGYNDGEWKQPFLRAVLSWYVRNRQFLNIYNKSDNNDILHVRYEELVRDPSEILMKIHKFVGIDPLPLASNWKQNPPHTFAGNIGVIKSKSEAIIEDKAWEKGLSKYQHIWINMITGRLNNKLLNGL